MKKIWKREGPVVHEGTEISLPYHGPGATGLGKPLKSILRGNPDIPVYIGASTPGNIRLSAEIADGWLGMHLAPDSVKDLIPVIQEGLAKRTDGKTLQDFVLRGSLGVYVNKDVRQALDAMKPGVALYTGGMGAKEKNYHKDAMIQRGFGDAADRIQELFLAGRKEEAAAAVPDEYIDDENLVGPAERIKQRWRPWLDSGLNMMTFMQTNAESLEVLGSFVQN